MPELPEVETTRRGLAPHVVGRRVLALVIRQPRLREPIAREVATRVKGRTVLRLSRRGKYLLLHFANGDLIVHLGMSGSLRIVEETAEAGSHDHVDWVLDSGYRLRFRDPRRFGTVAWASSAKAHALLRALGPEPLTSDFHATGLFDRSRGRRVAVKQFLMDHRVVAGIGNIYANEALFRAGIHPARAAGRIALCRYERLVEAVRRVLHEAIEAGGTTLRDFVGGEGQAGYFSQQLQVYGRAGQACAECGGVIACIRIGQRSTYYCPRCQR